MSALREILAVFGTEVDDSGLKKGEKGVESFKSTLKEFGETLLSAFAIERVVEFSREILESADVLAKQSQALSVSASDLQGWQWAAKLSGSSAEEFTGAFTKFNRNLAEAAKGAGPAADALKVFGVTAEDIKGKAPLDVLDLVADGFGKVEDTGKRTAAIMALLGKSGNKLAPLLLEGAEGVKKLRAEVGELGASFDEAFLENAQEVNDNIDRLKLGVRGLAIQAIGPLLPTITAWTQKGIELIKWVIDLTKHSSALQAAIVTFGTVGAAKAISGLVGLAQKAGFLKAGLRGVLFELAPLVLAFLALEDVWTFLNGGGSITGDLIEKFFGKDAPGKVKAFAATLKDTGLADIGLLLKGAFAIFTDGKPLSEKFQELLTYIEGTFRPALVKDFGEVGDDIASWISLLTTVADVLNRIKDLISWIAGQTIGRAILAADNVQAIQNRGEEDAASALSKDPNAWKSVYGGRLNQDGERARDTGPSFFDKLGGIFGIKKPDATAAAALSQIDVRHLVQESFGPTYATSTAPSAPTTTTVEQNVRAPITQNFYATTPEEVQKSASDGAQAGLKKGSDLLATQAAVKKTGA